ncbi:MAG TPA: transketolase C-terminal domain-containing protein [Anaerolineales bacterium]|jgi:transketolase|nr:transketolase C-terminal domain-containing protein [Anaerolineales bacterium]
MEIVSRPHAKNLVEWAKDKPRVVVLSADLTSSCEADTFREAYPDRFFSMGMAEQNMMGFAAGLAREGFFPYIHTFAVFITRRPFDQLAMSIAYPNLPVRLIGFLPGITTPGGVTHQAVDDVALMRMVPNMTILEVGDATEVESALDVAQSIEGPVYVRMLRGEVPRLFVKTEPIRLNRARIFSQGDDVTILSAGICTEEALRATGALAAKGVSLQHVHVSTHKPFTDPQVLAALASPRYGVITMENHLITGGLGSAVAEVMAEHGIGKKLVRLGLRDQYAHGASRPYLMKKYGLDAMALVHAVEGLLGKEFHLSEEDLAGVRLNAMHSAAKAEAL